MPRSSPGSTGFPRSSDAATRPPGCAPACASRWTAAPGTSSPRDRAGAYPRRMGSPPDPDCCRPTDPRIARQFDDRYTGWTDEEGFPDLVDVSGTILDLVRDATLRRPTVLELGCGTGGLGVALLEMGASAVTGIDLSPASIDLAQRRVAARGG